MRRLGIYEKAPSKAKKAQETEVTIAKYPVERYYQYTAIDEYIRKRYTYFTKSHSTYESTKFLEKVIKYYKFKIKLIQTDNGYEFTNRLSWRPTEKNKKTMLEKKLEELGIEYSLIRPNTPTQNGKVERRHRKAQEYFYHNNIFISLEDLREKEKDGE